MDIDDLFVEEVKGGKEDKNDLISMLFDPYYRSIIGSDEGMPLVELIVAVVIVAAGFVFGRLAVRGVLNLLLGGTMFGGNVL